jgi:hypothetical protein
MRCIFKGDDVALFKGQEVSPDQGPARIALTGNVEYFETGHEYAVVFQPVPLEG